MLLHTKKQELLAEELHKPIIRNEKRMKSIHFLKAVFGGVDIKLYADIQLVIKFNKGIFFYYVLLIFIENMRGLFT